MAEACSARIALEQIRRIRLYINSARRSLPDIREETGADYLINGTLYNMADFAPNCHLRSEGETLCEPPYQVRGFAWDEGPDIAMETLPGTRRNYIACTPLIDGGVPLGNLIYDARQGGCRGRSAMGLSKGALVLYCAGDGSARQQTPEQLRDFLAAEGWESAVMLDGGGSSQCCFRGEQIVSDRRVHDLVLVYLKEDDMEQQYVVTAVSGLNIRSGPGTEAEKIGGYACGAVVRILETQGEWGRTDKGWVSMAYLRATAEQDAGQVTDNGLRIQQDLIPAGRGNRPGGSNPDTYITIHETGNYARGAGALAHASWLKSDDAAKRQISYHYTVDDHCICQHLPDGERAYHAGDGGSGTGNACSIGIEICVNADGSFTQARANAASLVRLLMERHGIALANVVQHNRWNGKDCPYTIRHTEGAWEAFLALCGKQTQSGDPELETAVDALVKAGVIDSPQRWKALEFTETSVRLLLIKMAAALG